jgi:FKBP-type peptidyl-prolyl cis-trans isomerase
MKSRLGILILLLATTLVSCMKFDTVDDSWKNTIVPFDTTGKQLITTSTGLKYCIIKKGIGAKIENGLWVDVHFTFYLKGEIYNSTYKDNQTSSARLGTYSLIKGLEEGLSYLNEGDKVRLIVPPSLGYGNDQYLDIPGGSTLTYDIEVVKVYSDARIKAEKDSLATYVASQNITTPALSSGMYYLPIAPGTGDQAVYGKTATVNYIASYLHSGKVFDTNIEAVAKEKGIYKSTTTYLPFSFLVSSNTQLISGFKYGVSLMRKGGKAKLILPSYLAYDEDGSGIIPPYTTLVFEIELVNVE